MTLLQSLLLGIVQGITEFLPISSSGHLVLVPNLFGWQIPAEDAFVFNVLVQVATLAAVFVYFWADIIGIGGALIRGLRARQPFSDPQARLGWLIVLATIPAGLIGVLLKSVVESAFGSPLATASFLFVTAGLLVIAERIGKRDRAMSQITWQDALWIGFAQALALFPGVSRSGATITGGMARNLDRPSAARFSFLMSIPVMLAAGLFAVLDLIEISGFAERLPVFFAGFAAAAITGYLSIRWLLRFLSQRSLLGFAAYCVLFGIINLIFLR